MDRWLIALLAGLAGGAGGALAVRLLTDGRPEAAAASDDGVLRDVRDRLVAIEARLARPKASLADAGDPARGGAGPGGGPSVGPGTTSSGDVVSIARADLEAMAERAAEVALEKNAKTRKEAAAEPVKKRVSLADASRELQLTGAQEDELRRFYAEQTDKYLKLFAEPEGDAESLRRELDAAKDDAAKKAAIATRLIPKMFTKLGDVMALEVEKNARMTKIVGAEKAAKLERYDVVEEDPWGIGQAFTVGTTTVVGD
jgi:hypothetical protein